MTQPGQWNPQQGQPNPNQAPSQPYGQPVQPYGQQGYAPPAGYGQPNPYPQQGGGYPPQGGYPASGFAPGPPGTPPKKSALLIIGIVVAAVVALVAIGGIAIALGHNNDDTPGSTITASPPPVEPTSTELPSSSPSASRAPTQSSTPAPSSSSSPSQPGGAAVSVGNGITVTPASGWKVEEKRETAVQLSSANGVFVGQSVELDKTSNPAQLCTAWHKQVAADTSGGKFGEPKSVDLGTAKLKAATCAAQVTVSSGQGTSEIVLVTLASVRQSDGVTILGTLYFTSAADQDQLDKDFTAMVNSMLKSQLAG